MLEVIIPENIPKEFHNQFKMRMAKQMGFKRFPEEVFEIVDNSIWHNDDNHIGIKYYKKIKTKEKNWIGHDTGDFIEERRERILHLYLSSIEEYAEPIPSVVLNSILEAKKTKLFSKFMVASIRNSKDPYILGYINENAPYLIAVFDEPLYDEMLENK
jgi:hypothetical protein